MNYEGKFVDGKSKLGEIFKSTKSQFVKDQIIINRELMKIRNSEKLEEKKVAKLLETLTKYHDWKAIENLVENLPEIKQIFKS